MISKYTDVRQVKNRKLTPDLRREGTLDKPIIITCKDKLTCPWGDRLFSHHTLASVRRMSFFHPHPGTIQRDCLDLILNSTYNHSFEFMADCEDLYLQPETHGCETFRRLRNSVDKPPPVIIPLGHPMKVGGIKERRSPYSVKLMNAGVHSSQTNPGYSRQPAGGAIFFY